jgi:hypothetical protein
MTSFSYTLPDYRFTDARDLNALTPADYKFLAHWGADIQANDPILDTDFTEAQQKHAKSMISLQRLHMRRDFEDIQEFTVLIGSVVPKERMRKEAQLDRLRTLWCKYLEEYIYGSDIFVFVTGLSDDMDGGNTLSEEEVFSKRLEMARDALQEMLRISQPSSQLGAWNHCKIYVDDDFVLQWED